MKGIKAIRRRNYYQVMKGADFVLIGYLLYIIRSALVFLGNLMKKTRRPPDYVIFTLHGSYPELKEPPEGFFQKRMKGKTKSLQELENDLKIIGENPKVKGVIFHFGEIAMPLSRLQTLAGMIKKLQEKDKEVITWATSYDFGSYFLASFANRVLLQKGGVVYTLGLGMRQLYMKKALDWAGVKFDVVQITPYKSAMERFMRSDMSKEVREMLSWLADSQYEQMVKAISLGRKIDNEKIDSFIENTPYNGEEALEAGAVDGIVNSDDLPEFLGEKPKPARLATWAECGKVFPRPLPPLPGKYIAVLRVQGNIVDGKSQRPPGRRPMPIPFLFNEQTGDLTFVQQARLVLKDKRARAVLLYIDSGGGSAASSEAISSALSKLAAKKPLVAMMGSVAGSGGYYVATPASYIVAQPSTITGSIGVISAKIVNSALLEKLLLNREIIQRGKRDLFGSPEEPFTDEERKKAWNFIYKVYELFLKRVADSRKMSTEEVDKIGGGRVWTGEQALENGLVDELGGLDVALKKLRSLAKLPENTPLVEIPFPRRYFSPVPSAASWIDFTLDNIKQVQKNQALLAGPAYFSQPSDHEPGLL